MLLPPRVVRRGYPDRNKKAAEAHQLRIKLFEALKLAECDYLICANAH
jgi:hypothetical protein